jgi:hypothetical protein
MATPAAAAAAAAAAGGRSAAAAGGRGGGSGSSAAAGGSSSSSRPPLLGIDPKKIRGDEELRRIFGAGVIEAVDRMEGESLHVLFLHRTSFVLENSLTAQRLHGRVCTCVCVGGGGSCGLRVEGGRGLDAWGECD